MKFRANLNQLALAKGQLGLVDDFIREVMEDSARVWLDAVTKIVPVWSGASRATFQALASAINYHISIEVRGDAPDRIALGRLASRGGLQRRAPGYWEFYYETQLRYLIANETRKVSPGTEGLRGSLIKPTPYMFREAGKKAVEAYIKQIEKGLSPIKPLRKK